VLTTSLIIAFYNRIDYLQMVVAGLERQSFQNFEVIIADDGSSGDTVSQVNELILTSPLKIKHVWHEDNGFQKNKILNQALQCSNSEYLIFIDMDCVPHKEFIREHMENKAEHIFLTGRRVNLSKKFTQKLTPDLIKRGYLETHLFSLMIDGLFGKSKDIEKGFYVKSPLLRKILNRKRRGILGCNFSIHKKDILAINGFDERYKAPSIGEDTDVQFRLELNGVRIKNLKHIAIQYHLFHNLLPRPQANLDLFKEIKKEKKAYTSFGLTREHNELP
jgi:glycosyltransferase involved in cell wall biosynthesis